jgi:hypothetical protein
MKIICVIKITCPLKDGIATPPFAPTVHKNQLWTSDDWTSDDWLANFFKHSVPYIYRKFDLKEEFHYQTQNAPYSYQEKTNHDSVLLFDSEEELNTWANNCRLTDPQLIADQEMWETAHGITIAYEYYSLLPTTGPEPIL